MTSTQDALLLKVYAPALVGGDGRPLAVVHAMERALPGLRLGWTLSDEGRFIPLPQRDAWLSQETKEGGFPILCNGDESHFVTLNGWKIPAGLSPGGAPLCDIHLELPLDATSLAAAEDVLEGVAEGAHAFWGQLTPQRAAGDIAEQTSLPFHGPHRPPWGLPVLKKAENLRSPEIPHYLGWLNYWSAATARAIGFPDPARDADLLSLSRRTTRGGWMVRLTESPLELHTPAHRDALLRAYERFPEIGGRCAT